MPPKKDKKKATEEAAPEIPDTPEQAAYKEWKQGFTEGLEGALELAFRPNNAESFRHAIWYVLEQAEGEDTKKAVFEVEGLLPKLFTLFLRTMAFDLAAEDLDGFLEWPEDENLLEERPQGPVAESAEAMKLLLKLVVLAIAAPAPEAPLEDEEAPPSNMDLYLQMFTLENIDAFVVLPWLEDLKAKTEEYEDRVEKDNHFNGIWTDKKSTLERLQSEREEAAASLEELSGAETPVPKLVNQAKKAVRALDKEIKVANLEEIDSRGKAEEARKNLEKATEDNNYTADAVCRVWEALLVYPKNERVGKELIRLGFIDKCLHLLSANLRRYPIMQCLAAKLMSVMSLLLDCRVQVRKLRGIDLMVPLFSSPDQSLRRQILKTCSEFVVDVETRMMIVTLGGLDALRTHATGEDIVEKTLACHLLACSCDVVSAGRIREAGCVEPATSELLKLWEEELPTTNAPPEKVELLETCAEVIARASLDPRSRWEIGLTGVVHRIIMPTLAPDYNEYKNLQRKLLEALVMLSEQRENRLKVKAEESMDYLLAFVSGSGHTQLLAMKALACFSSYEFHRDMIVASEAYQPIEMFAEMLSHRDKEIASYSAIIIGHLATNPKAKDQVRDSGCFEILLDMLDSGDGIIRRNSLMCLKACLRLPANAIELCRVRGVQRLVHMVKSPIQYRNFGQDVLDCLLQQNLPSKLWLRSVLDYADWTQNDFYDCGLRDFKTLDDLRKEDVHRMYPDTILIDWENDSRLIQVLEKLREELVEVASVADKYACVAGHVANMLGGSMTFEEYEGYDMRIEVDRCKRGGSNNVVQIGAYSKVGARHRSILFKCLCDRVDMESKLVRGEHKRGFLNMHSWNLVVIDGEECVVDVLHDVGDMHVVGSPEYFRYTRENEQAFETMSIPVPRFEPPVKELASHLDTLTASETVKTHFSLESINIRSKKKKDRDAWYPNMERPLSPSVSCGVLADSANKMPAQLEIVDFYHSRVEKSGHAQTVPADYKVTEQSQNDSWAGEVKPKEGWEPASRPSSGFAETM